MASANNLKELDDSNPGDVNPLIGKSVYHQLHIWHQNTGGQFTPYRKLTVDKALMFIKGYMVLPKTAIVHIDEEKVSQFLDRFKHVFSWGGNYWPVTFKRLIIPRDTEQSVESYINRYGLSEYRDFIWYLIARLQVFYTQKIAFGNLKDKKYTALIYKSQQDYLAIQRLIQYVLDGRDQENDNPLTVTLKQKGYKHVLEERWVLRFLLNDFIKGFLSENGKLIPNWKRKIASFESSHAIKDDFEHIHRNFGIAFMEFLKRQKIVAGINITAEYLNPVVELLNISEYPFISVAGDKVTVRHIKSLLKSSKYILPVN